MIVTGLTAGLLSISISNRRRVFRESGDPTGVHSAAGPIDPLLLMAPTDPESAFRSFPAASHVDPALIYSPVGHSYPGCH